MKFVMVTEEKMKKADKRALSTLYLYWLESGKPDSFDLPLFVSKEGKGVLSVEAFKRVFYAFQLKANTGFDAKIQSGNDGNDAEYNVVRVTKALISFDSADDVTFFDDVHYNEPKETDLKRESSKKTAEKSEAKKADAKKEADDLNKACKMKILSSIEKIAPSYAKFDNKKLSDFMTAIEKILNENF